ERLAFFDQCEALIAAAAHAGRDVPVADVLPDHPLWRPMFDTWVAAYASADADRLSTLDWVNYRDTEENWPVPGGLGAILQRFGGDLPVATETPVTAIRHAADKVIVETASGAVEAGAVVVTVSTSVLAADGIAFDPPLPAEKRAAIAAIPLGHSNKLALAFDGNPFGEMRAVSVRLAEGTSESPLLQIRPFGRDIVTGFLGGRFASAMERAGEAATVDFVMERLTAMFGPEPARRLRAARVSTWESDPWIRGA